jgi:hypothetical protein
MADGMTRTTPLTDTEWADLLRTHGIPAPRASGGGGSDEERCELLSGSGVRALAMFDSDCCPQFVHLTLLDVCFTHEVCERVGNGIQLALDGLVAPALRVLKHGHQHHDYDRHHRRTGSKPCVRKTSYHPKRKPDDQTRETSRKERPSTHGMGCYSRHLIEAGSLPIDRAWRGCPRLSAYLQLPVFVLHRTPTTRRPRTATLAGGFKARQIAREPSPPGEGGFRSAILEVKPLRGSPPEPEGFPPWGLKGAEEGVSRS